MFLLHLASFVHVFVVKKESLVSFESVIQCRAFYSRSTSLRYISIGLLDLGVLCLLGLGYCA